MFLITYFIILNLLPDACQANLTKTGPKLPSSHSGLGNISSIDSLIVL
jgi:hypothetical protein